MGLGWWDCRELLKGQFGTRTSNRLTPLAALAFAFAISGIAFGSNRFLAYTMLGFGVLLAVVDAHRRRRTRRNPGDGAYRLPEPRAPPTDSACLAKARQISETLGS